MRSFHVARLAHRLRSGGRKGLSVTGALLFRDVRLFECRCAARTVLGAPCSHRSFFWPASAENAVKEASDAGDASKQPKVESTQPQEAATAEVTAKAAKRKAERRAELQAVVEARKPHVARAREVAKWPNTAWMRFLKSFWWDSTGRSYLEESQYGGHPFLRKFRAETTDLVHDFQHWHILHRPSRNIWLTMNVLLRADVVRRLAFPDLLLLGSTAQAVAMYNEWALPLGYRLLTLPIEPFHLTAMALGLLATFRTQASYARFDQARDLWQATATNCREIFSRIMARIPMPRSTMAKHPQILQKRDIGAKLAQTFPHALKYHLTLDGCNADSDIKPWTPPEEAWREKRARLKDELELIWDFEDAEERSIVERLLREDVHNLPLQVCQELTYLNATQYATLGGLSPPNSEGLDARITALQQALASCERIIQTPVYSPYTKFTGRVLYMWLFALPFALYQIVGPMYTAPTVVVVSLIFLGIDEIGRTVEQPFDNLPLWQFVEDIDRSCEQIYRNAKALGCPQRD